MTKTSQGPIASTLTGKRFSVAKIKAEASKLGAPISSTVSSFPSSFIIPARTLPDARMYSPLHKSPCRAMISPGSKCFKLFGRPNRKATNSSSFIPWKGAICNNPVSSILLSFNCYLYPL